MLYITFISLFYILLVEASEFEGAESCHKKQEMRRKRERNMVLVFVEKSRGSGKSGVVLTLG